MTCYLREEQYVMNTLQVSNISASNLTGNVNANTLSVGLGRGNLATFGGGACFNAAGWDAPAATHTLTIPALTGYNPVVDVSGTLFVNVSNKTGNVGHAISIVIASANTLDVKPIGIASQGMTAPAVGVASGNVAVYTDADCAVAWTFVYAV